MTRGSGHRSRWWRPLGVVALVIAVVGSSVAAWHHLPAHAALATRHRRPPLGHGTVSHLSLPSGDRNGARRAVWVYRPAVADSAHLPVVYYLHGFPGGTDDPDTMGLAQLLDERNAKGAAPFVLVAPDGNGPVQEDTEWADAADGAIKLESFVIDNLIAAVEGHHRRPARDRALIGFSMGGYGAINIGLHHPDLYGQLVSVAGYYLLDDPDGIGIRDQAWRERNNPSHHLAAAKGRRFLLVRPDNEGDPLMDGEDQRIAPLLRAAGASTVATWERSGQHDLDFARSQFPSIFDFLSQGWEG
jgi:S-formylglutathione hydrolase FrmB